jgi:nicotinamidase-related amidase
MIMVMTTVSTAFTLRSAAGLPANPPALESTVLVIIDAQQEYTTGLVPLTGVDAAVGVIAALLATARAAGSPVVHVMHEGRPGGMFDPTAGGAPIAAVTPDAGEIVVHKPLPNAFAATDLDVELKRIGVKALTIVGFMTHMCVSSTARAAIDHGYDVTVVGDACATRDLPGVAGADPIEAEVIHQVALAELADRFAIVTTSVDFVGAAGAS